MGYLQVYGNGSAELWNRWHLSGGAYTFHYGTAASRWYVKKDNRIKYTIETKVMPGSRFIKNNICHSKSALCIQIYIRHGSIYIRLVQCASTLKRQSLWQHRMTTLSPSRTETVIILEGFSGRTCTVGNFWRLLLKGSSPGGGNCSYQILHGK